MKKESTALSHKDRIVKAIGYIHDNITEELNLEDVASNSCYSKFHFLRIFKAFTNESFMEYTRRLRLERAAVLLLRENISITEVAFDSCYENVESFSRAFKKQFTLSPRDYRNQGGAPEVSSLHIDETLFEIGEVMKDAKIVTLDKKKVAYVHHIGPYNECGKAWDAVCTALAKQGLLNGTNEFFGICFDSPEVTDADKIRYDACVTIDKDFKSTEEIAVKEIGGGEYAVFTHEGPYEQLNDTYNAIYRNWFPTSGKELKDEPSMELYLNDPESAEPEDLLTDIYIALK